MNNPYLPLQARIVERIQESASLFTLRLELTDPEARAAYRFEPGQFNMLYLYGCGEVPISIVSEDSVQGTLMHTVRALGRITRGLAQLGVGDRIGLHPVIVIFAALVMIIGIASIVFAHPRKLG